MAQVTGVVLAAGAGTRAGGPKGLRRDASGVPWIARVCAALTDGGCAPVVVVTGASAPSVAALAPAGVVVVEAADWESGVAASLRAGLAAVPPDAVAALVVLVDEPDLPAAAVARMLTRASADALARAAYDGRPGHPVLLGRDHLPDVVATASGDRGAGPYLRAHDAREVECADLWPGDDVDGPEG